MVSLSEASGPTSSGAWSIKIFSFATQTCRQINSGCFGGVGGGFSILVEGSSRRWCQSSGIGCSELGSEVDRL
ncbi:MAG: hypothetical protein CL912_18220 [Deltaproteobacteria bacterium]|nr:hypothetical protein [Deltaproteobacteria bacterium]